MKLLRLVALVAAATPSTFSQFPYAENFDLVFPPELPTGWISSQNRTPGTNDFTTTISTPRSFPNTAISTNATIGQELHSRVLDFSGTQPDSVVFYTRRSSSHNARLVVEASLDSGATYTVPIGDTLRNAGSTNFVLHGFALPDTLSTSANVRLRWRVLPDPAGATGTLRIDDILVTTKVMHDLEMYRISFSPAAATESDSVVALAAVRNSGLSPAENFVVEFYHDSNNDSIPQSPEFLTSSSVASTLVPSETLQVFIPLGSWPPGSHSIIAVAVYPPDQSLENNREIAQLRVGYRPQSIVINEILYAPISGEPEWVELYNNRPDSISLRGWLVSDNLVSAKKLITSVERYVPPFGFVVLTKDSAGLVDLYPGIASMTIDVSALPTLNNSGDAAVLYDDRAATMDSVSYLPVWGGNSGGNSLDRIDPLGSSTHSLNWGTSRLKTPGKKNSLTRKEFDIVLDTVWIQPGQPISGEDVAFTVGVRNVGLQVSPQQMVLLYEDTNSDSLAQYHELIDSAMVAALSPLDSASCLVQIDGHGAGRYDFIVTVKWEMDEDSVNNTLRSSLVIGYPSGTVCINEIMYAPSAGVPEWAEFVNVGADTIVMEGWKLGNRSGTPRYVISQLPITLSPNALLVVTKDTALLRTAYPGIPGAVVQSAALPTFLWNNSGDAVVLVDNRNAVMDTVQYHPAWGGFGGMSLERIDPLGDPQDSLNWSSSVDSMNATPGRPNSIVVVDHDMRMLRVPMLSVTPGEPAVFIVTVQNAGRLPTSAFNVGLYHDTNRDSVAEIGERVAETTVTQSLVYRETLQVEIVWPSPSSGLLPVLVQIGYPDDERLRNNDSWTTIKVGYATRSLVINEIMYAPFSGKAEYVELLNISDHVVDAAYWTVSDMPSATGSFTTLSLGANRREIAPGAFMLLASDSSILASYPTVQEMDTAHVLVARSTWPGLNNDGDAVVLRDPIGQLIDSVQYHPSWHNPGVADNVNRSLEKINPRLGSNDKRGWSTCAHFIGGTPGRQNSIFTTVTPSSSSVSFSPNPFSPDGDGWEDFTLIHFELPLRVSVIRITIFDVKGRLIRTLANNEPAGATGNIVWDGNDDDGRKARIGMYVVILEGVDQGGGVVETAKGVVVLAAKL